MTRKNTDIMVTGQQQERLSDKYSGRLSRFTEVMNGIYGEDAADKMPAAQLIARHREVADKLLGRRKRKKEEDFFAKPKTDVIN